MDLVRQDAAQLMRLRHPGVVRVIQALDESKASIAMVTEPIFASVANVLGRHDNISKVPSELKDLVSTCNVHLLKGSTLELCILISVNVFCFFVFLQDLGQLEVKHGLLQLAETLGFLHNNARLLHRALSPEVSDHLVYHNMKAPVSNIRLHIFRV